MEEQQKKDDSPMPEDSFAQDAGWVVRQALSLTPPDEPPPGTEKK